MQLKKPVLITIGIIILCGFIDRHTGIKFVYVATYFLHWLIPVALLVTHIGLGICIYRDAQKRKQLLVAAPPWLWACVGFSGGIIGLAAYWLANYVCVAKTPADESAEETPD